MRLAKSRPDSTGVVRSRDDCNTNVGTEMTGKTARKSMSSEVLNSASASDLLALERKNLDSQWRYCSSLTSVGEVNSIERGVPHCCSTVSNHCSISLSSVPYGKSSDLAHLA